MVSVFPIPGARAASPQTQIAFRGLPIKQLGSVVVTGSRSGRHAGRLESDSDGRGGSFLPAKPFVPGEVVTVRTGLRVAGATAGTFPRATAGTFPRATAGTFPGATAGTSPGATAGTPAPPRNFPAPPRERFHFTVAMPSGSIPATPLPPASRVPGDELTFHSRPDLTPASVEVTKEAPNPGPDADADATRTTCSSPPSRGRPRTAR